MPIDSKGRAILTIDHRDAEGASGAGSFLTWFGCIRLSRFERPGLAPVVACLCLVLAMTLAACSAESRDAGGASQGSSVASASAGGGSESASGSGGESASQNGDSPGNSESVATKPAEREASYPTAWAITAIDDIPVGTAIELLYAPGMEIEAHRDGAVLSSEEAKHEQEGWPAGFGGEGALVRYAGNYRVVDPNLLLVNLPDVMPDAVYDIVYSYSATSNCAGIAIPGVTGERIVGYVYGKQESAYWADARFVAPCAYRTALKAMDAARFLRASGYRLLVYDAYRPMSAQYYLSDAFERAYQENPRIQESVGGWSLNWYVASGASGHNYGTDLDVGVCDLEGRPLAMPSTFDAFDEGGHLTRSSLDKGSITPADYRDAILGNDACMALHEAFKAAGFSELASEWWHFGDDEAEMLSVATIGNAGLDFTASTEK